MNGSYCSLCDNYIRSQVDNLPGYLRLRVSSSSLVRLGATPKNFGLLLEGYRREFDDYIVMRLWV